MASHPSGTSPTTSDCNTPDDARTDNGAPKPYTCPDDLDTSRLAIPLYKGQPFNTKRGRGYRFYDSKLQEWRGCQPPRAPKKHRYANKVEYAEIKHLEGISAKLFEERAFARYGPAVRRPKYPQETPNMSESRWARLMTNYVEKLAIYKRAWRYTRPFSPVPGAKATFMSLPQEIRDQINRYNLVTGELIEFVPLNGLARAYGDVLYGTVEWQMEERDRILKRSLLPQGSLLRVCKQMHAETRQLLYGENTFAFSDTGGWAVCSLFLNSIGACNRSEIRHIQVVAPNCGSRRGLNIPSVDGIMEIMCLVWPFRFDDRTLGRTSDFLIETRLQKLDLVIPTDFTFASKYPELPLPEFHQRLNTSYVEALRAKKPDLEISLVRRLSPDHGDTEVRWPNPDGSEEDQVKMMGMGYKSGYGIKYARNGFAGLLVVKKAQWPEGKLREIWDAEIRE